MGKMKLQTEHDKARSNLECGILWIFLSVIMIVTIACLEASASAGGMDNAIKQLVSVAPHHKLNDDEKRTEFSDMVKSAGAKWEIPSDLILAISYLESSLSPAAVGSIGEIGLMQVHGMAARDCDLDTDLGQLECGAKWLRKCKDKCGTWERALTAYAVGTCQTASKHVQRKIKYRMRFWNKVKRLMQ